VRNKIIFSLAVAGVLAGLVAAYIFGIQRKAQPPVFAPASSPYATAIFANGIIESDQSSGSNINVYPEVSGAVTQVLAKEGQSVAVLLKIDDSVQKQTTAQLRSQSEAALALLNELKAEPRKETLEIAGSQVDLAAANLKAARDQYDKDRAAYDADPHSISKSVLDIAEDAVHQGDAAVEVARRQYALTKAGAWSFDILNQQKTYDSLNAAYEAAAALLVKYTIRSQTDGVVLALYAGASSYVSPLGVYDTYTQGQDPIMVIGPPQEYLAVRCFVDEILVSRLPNAFHIRAQMSVRGSTIKVPLEFVRVQPVIFRFRKQDSPVYPGQEVDVYIGQQ
jgi:HlyD family secretion protein